jgi:hypothetical protein
MKDLLNDKGFLRILILFMVTTGLIILFKNQLDEKEIDPIVAGFGNLILFLASVLTLAMYGKAKRSSTSHGFSKNIYAAFVIKFFILITAVMLYFYFSSEISTRAVFLCMGLYLVYHFVGASYAARVEKKKAKPHHP